MMLCSSVSLFAQATDLVVDNQTPGRLSSKINYGDQMTVRNLKVTGYINNVDMTFIGTLFNRNLNGVLDLSECDLIGETPENDNYLKGFGLSKNDTIQKYYIPKSASKVSMCTEKLHVDSLFFDCKMSYVHSTFFDGNNTSIKMLYLGENVDSIPGQSIINNTKGIGFCGAKDIERVIFSKNLKYIGGCSFLQSGLKDTNLKDLNKLELIGPFAFGYIPVGSQYMPDSLWVNAKSFNASAFVYKNGQHIFINKNVQSITTGADLNKTYGFATNMSLIFHMESPTPPSGHAPNNKCTVYVPKGAKATYMNSNWKNATIIEQNPVEIIKMNESKVELDKDETKQLSISFTPADADDKSVVWSIEDPAIATVNEEGLVTALSPGKTIVTVKSVPTGIQASCEIVVLQHVTGVSMSVPSLEMTKIGETIQLTANVTPEDATDKSVKWSSTNTNVCSVTESGNVIALGYGTAIVIATTTDGSFPATCVVNVIQPVTVKAQNKTKIYGDPNPTFEYSSEGADLVGTPEIICEATETTPVGEYPIVITKGSVTNSNDSYINGTLTITKAPLKVSVGKYTRVQGEEDPEFTFSYEGFKNGDDVSVLLTKPTAYTTATKDSEVGEYPIYISGGEAQNYELFYTDGVLTVIASTGIDSVVNSESKVFDVYSIGGTKVRSNVTTLNNLTKGVYIVNRKKVVVK